MRFSVALIGLPSAIEASASGVISRASAAACSAAFMRSPEAVFAECAKATRSAGVNGVARRAIRTGLATPAVSTP